MLTPTEKFIFSKPIHPSPLEPRDTPVPLLPLPYQHHSRERPELTTHACADSFLFLFFSMIAIALTLYLPQHLAFLTNRAWFYYNGDEIAKAAVQSAAETATTTILVEHAQETIANTMMAEVGATIVDVAREL